MKHIFTLITIILFLLIPVCAHCEEPYTIDIRSDRDAILAGQNITYTATITNNLNRADTVELSITGGPQTNWVTLNDYSVKLNQNETRQFGFYISAPYDTPVNKYLFRLKAISKNDTKNIVSKDIYMYVIEVAKIDLTIFATDKDYYKIGEKVTLTTGVRNMGTGKSKNATLKIELTGLTAGEKTINIPPLEVEQEHIEKAGYTFDKYLDKGTYELTGTLFDENNLKVRTQKTSFEIEKKVIIKQKRDVSSTMFEKTIKIQATNNGNDKGTARIEESKSKIPQIIEFNREPEEGVINYDTKYGWTCELEPLETCTITYKIKYWIYFVAAIIIIAILFMILNFAEKPRITKKYRKGATHTVSIEIKNNSRRTLDDVQVQDMVPQVFSIAESSGTVRPALVKRKKNGTLLVWKLGKLSPKDERIISYRIKPILDVEGGIKLPPAKIIGKDPNNVKKKSISQHITIK